MSHGQLLVFEITILVLAIFLGFEVISKVPTLLHTPLMSGTNAIHGIVIVGAMLVMGGGHKDTLTWVIGFVAVILASANVVGGFVVTDRMPQMFRRPRPHARDVRAPPPPAPAARRGRRQAARPVSRTTTDLLYLVTIVTFILALRFLSRPDKARLGNWIGAAGMLLAIAVTFAQNEIVSYWQIALGMLIGGGFGAVAARRVKMTAMPQMVALFNGVGGGAAALVSWAEFHNRVGAPGNLKVDIGVAIMLSALIGAVSFAGSMVAFAKLQELIQGRPITYPGQQVVNALVLGGALAAGIAIAAGGEEQWLMWVLLACASIFGVLFVLPIGGADMPVVISLLNAFTGLAAAATGFELENNVLIVSGMLVGASGTLLTLMMSRAMNRSIANVLFGAFGQVTPSAAAS